MTRKTFIKKLAGLFIAAPVAAKAAMEISEEMPRVRSGYLRVVGQESSVEPESVTITKSGIYETSYSFRDPGGYAQVIMTDQGPYSYNEKPFTISGRKGLFPIQIKNIEE